MAHSTQPITIRNADPGDALALARLAARDSRRLPAGSLAVAEVGGSPVAAISLSDGAVVADPFRPTAHVVVLLKVHAADLAASQNGDTPGRCALRAGLAVLRGRASRRPQAPAAPPVVRPAPQHMSLAAHALLRAH